MVAQPLAFELVPFLPLLNVLLNPLKLLLCLFLLRELHLDLFAVEGLALLDELANCLQVFVVALELLFARLLLYGCGRVVVVDKDAWHVHFDPEFFAQ